MPVMSTALESELVAMIIGGPWINLDLGNAKVNYDIGVLPKLKKSITMALSAATVIYQSSENRDEAWILFKWLLDPEKSLELYSGGLWMPTMKKWYTDQSLVEKWVDSNPYAHPPGFKDAMINQFLKNGIAQPRYYLKNQARIEPIVIAGLDRVWLGMQTAEDALEEIEQNVAPFFMGRYETNGYTEPVDGN
jgi:multiple sugar transport system substrate-binding protein